MNMKEKEIEVTITIATYGQEKYIKQCLDSVFSQITSFRYQVVVAEDASPDNTRQILLEYKEQYGDQLILILHDKNLGPSANSASMRPYIKGKYVALIEGDDYWTDKNKLQKQYDILENNSQYSAVCCDNMTVDSYGNTITEKNLALQKDMIKTMKDWQNEPYSVHTCTIFRRDIFPNSDPRYIELRHSAPTMGDIITFSILYDYGPIYVMKDVMAAHRIAGEKDTSSFSIRNQKEPLKYTRMFIDIFSNVEKFFNHKYDFTKRKCIKIAYIIFGKLTGYYCYHSSDLRRIIHVFPIRWQVYIYIRVIQEIIKLITGRIARLWSKTP